ncbi:endonuclease domain-containing protein [Aliifodinibius sp. S!AR15-10]|uniref:endonuclease domain-containing protein n=1 Tax=Aliifodinibius sp. S!AR15-10 TaxID=2950437 RepID=UPI002855BA2E|nr:endonuclease domain-containing protein [Aliifodinibius sp. S!AR15-10]MDR8393903.1 endonuclease domain-containing protein [Aliifodinibius sp. S!AR15-10]
MEKPRMFYGAPPYIFEKARELRKSMTKAETKLWNQLNKKQLGYKFRRQHPISEFIADFYCHSSKLVIEVDGGIHSKKEHQEYDIKRSNKLNRFGITVIRFKNQEILRNVQTVLKRITTYLE